MRRLLARSLVAGCILGLVAAFPVAAVTREDVTIVVMTTFDGQPDAFVAEGLPGCESGLVYDPSANLAFAPPMGIFAGFKEFRCADVSGFVLRLNARFSYSGGSVGTWTVVRSWGSVAGIHGAGMLTGVPFAGGITDNYVGTVTL